MFTKKNLIIIIHIHINFYLMCRYVLYDVNKPEGFNLRRDVFIRMASFIHHMNNVSDYHWILVNLKKI